MRRCTHYVYIIINCNRRVTVLDLIEHVIGVLIFDGLIQLKDIKFKLRINFNRRNLLCKLWLYAWGVVRDQDFVRAL